jgi:hypothetical protein
MPPADAVYPADPADAIYMELLLKPVRKCADYLPTLGKSGNKRTGPIEFAALYGADPFYHWVGLDNPLMYAAHKAAGGMTSIYRQIGIGCERLFRRLLVDHLGLSADKVTWHYELGERTLSLDGRVTIEEIPTPADQIRVQEWLDTAADHLGLAPRVKAALAGSVFEVRQGYKSKDSKRQHADIANAATAYSRGFLPCLIVFSAQIDEDVLTRYRNKQWLVLTGQKIDDSPLRSTYKFCKDVIGYDLAAFFERQSATLREALREVLEKLLSPGD